MMEARELPSDTPRSESPADDRFDTAGPDNRSGLRASPDWNQAQLGHDDSNSDSGHPAAGSGKERRVVAPLGRPIDLASGYSADLRPRSTTLRPAS